MLVPASPPSRLKRTSVAIRHSAKRGLPFEDERLNAAHAEEQYHEPSAEIPRLSGMVTGQVRQQTVVAILRRAHQCVTNYYQIENEDS